MRSSIHRANAIHAAQLPSWVPDVTADLVVAAGVALFAPEAAEDLRRRVTRLPWGLLVGLENLVDRGVEPSQRRRRRVLRAVIRLGLRAHQSPPDLAASMV